MVARPFRVDPVSPPYSPELQAVFDRIMPSGVPPLTLFTTLARVPRIYDRFRAASLLDRGPLSLRHREIVIDRTCARCGCRSPCSLPSNIFEPLRMIGLRRGLSRAPRRPNKAAISGAAGKDQLLYFRRAG